MAVATTSIVATGALEDYLVEDVDTAFIAEVAVGGLIQEAELFVAPRAGTDRGRSDCEVRLVVESLVSAIK